MLRRRLDVLSQSTTPFACTLLLSPAFPGKKRRDNENVTSQNAVFRFRPTIKFQGGPLSALLSNPCGPPPFWLELSKMIFYRHFGVSENTWNWLPRGPGEASQCREAKIAARQYFAAQLCRNYPHHGGNFERGKIALSCGGVAISMNLGGILRGNFGEGNCESNIAARQWGVNFCREASSRCLARPSG